MREVRATPLWLLEQPPCLLYLSHRHRSGGISRMGHACERVPPRGRAPHVAPRALRLRPDPCASCPLTCVSMPSSLNMYLSHLGCIIGADGRFVCQAPSFQQALALQTTPTLAFPHAILNGALPEPSRGRRHMLTGLPELSRASRGGRPSCPPPSGSCAGRSGPTTIGVARVTVGKGAHVRRTPHLAPPPLCSTPARHLRHREHRAQHRRLRDVFPLKALLVLAQPELIEQLERRQRERLPEARAQRGTPG